MSDFKQFKYDSVQDMQTVIKYLDAIAEGFRTGELTFTREGESMVFKPGGLLGFTVEAKSKGVRRKLKISLGWKEQETDGGACVPPLHIQAGAASAAGGASRGKKDE